MSAGGNVPTQGVVVQAATTEKKRNSAGKVGKGSAGGRLKSLRKREAPDLPLRAFVRHVAGYRGTDPGGATAAEDAKFWLSTKRYRGSDEQRAERKAKGERVKSLAFSDSKSSLSTPAKKKTAG